MNYWPAFGLSELTEKDRKVRKKLRENDFAGKKEWLILDGLFGCDERKSGEIAMKVLQ